MQSPISNQNNVQVPREQLFSQQQGHANNAATHQTKIKEKRKLKLNLHMGGMFNTKTLLALVVILQIIMIALILVNPATLIQQWQNNRVIAEVATKVTDIKPGDNPTVATVTDANSLRSQNAAQAQVYKDALNGDYVLGYSDRLIIFRTATDTVIYNGPNPNDLVTQTQAKIIKDITDKAKAQAYIPQDNTETAQISVITDITTLQKTNPTFYKVGRNNDIVALFPIAQVIILYSQDTSTILNAGKYSTNIGGI